MKRILKIAVLVFLPFLCNAQLTLPDSVVIAYRNATNDSVKFFLNRQITGYYFNTNQDSSLVYAEEGLRIARRNNMKMAEGVEAGLVATGMSIKGKYAESLKLYLTAFAIMEDPEIEKRNEWPLLKDKSPHYQRLNFLSSLHNAYSGLMERIKNTDKQFFHAKEAIRIAEEGDIKYRLMVAYMTMSKIYSGIDNLDSALWFTSSAEKLGRELNEKVYYCYIPSELGYIHFKKANKEIALGYYHSAIALAREQKFMSALSRGYLRLCNYYLAESEKDSSLYYAKLFEQTFTSQGRVDRLDQDLGVVYEKLYQSYQLLGQKDSTLKYARLTIAAKDSISNDRLQNMAAFQKTLMDEQIRLQNIEKEKKEYQNRIRTYILSAGLGVIFLVAFLLYRNNRQKHTANLVLQEQKDKVESTLQELKSTQSQLIQSEKMASLGELTAGIAHEIQNPLNFVNNFSELSSELIAEMNVELNNGDIEEAKIISANIKQNLEKINHHGKRADAIVKGMLEHSRAASGVKEPTEINVLADEYLRLAYHGFQAKDTSFNAALKTDFDSAIGSINIIPQDIGRVVLNLINNAFYAVNERSKKGEQGYVPTVAISTLKEGSKVRISAKDNGSGITESIKEKIFQPFFTTKPTGQGTGLGLSLAYDIVKAHGGELKVETKEGEGSEFVIHLPL
jgi:two-component system, NtrC family, sensor kinase